MNKRVFAGGIHLESNSFTPLKTTYDDFAFTRGAEMLSLAGVKDLAEAGCEVIPSLFADAVPGGVVALRDFLWIVGEILADLPADGSVDGVMLLLHGSLEVEGIGSGEAYLVSRIREMVGPNVPIAAALDLHGNNTYTLAALSNILYGYRTAPHIDIPETRSRTAELLLRALEEGALPWTQLLRIPLMLPGENMMTESGPGAEIIRRLDDIEAVEGVWCASYFAGMPWVDCAQNGSALVVSGTGCRGKARKAMEELGLEIWQMRDDFRFLRLSLPTDEAVRYALESDKTPVFLSDSADNITAGSTGDNAFLLGKLLEAGATGFLVAPLVDAPVVEACIKAGEGGRLYPRIGASLDKKSHSVEVEAEVLRVYPAAKGRCNAAVVRIQGGELLLFDSREPVFTEEDLARFGLKAADYKLIVVKQGYLSPEFDAIAGDYVLALTPGNCAQDLHLLEYHKIRRPMYPVDSAARFPAEK